MSGLASMYPASDWSGLVLPAIMDISARAISLPDIGRFDQAYSTAKALTNVSPKSASLIKKTHTDPKMIALCCNPISFGRTF